MRHIYERRGERPVDIYLQGVRGIKSLRHIYERRGERPIDIYLHRESEVLSPRRHIYESPGFKSLDIFTGVQGLSPRDIFNQKPGSSPDSSIVPTFDS